MVAMNLFMPGEGISKTHVTWNDIEKSMQHELQTKATLGPNRSAKDIGDGKGYMSKVFLIDADWKNKDKNLPDKFVLKVITPIPWVKYTTQVSKLENSNNDFCQPTSMEFFEAFLKRAHNAEVAAYRHLSKLPEGKIQIPKIYDARDFCERNTLKGYILMEYLENDKEREIFESFSLGEIRQLLRHLAVIEAASLDIPFKEMEHFFSGPFSTLCTAFTLEEEREEVFAMLMEQSGSKLASEVARLRAIAQDMADNLKWADELPNKFNGMRSVLCHGDIYPMNTIWKKGDGEHKLVAVIDYQTCHFGCAATDLVQIFVTFLSGKERRAHWEQLMEEFYGYLKQEVGNKKMPYSLEQLKEAYLQFFPTGAFTLIPFIAPLFEVIAKNVQQESKRKEYSEKVMEKVECLLDDLLQCHDRNLKIHVKN
ncbi:hypothetical protein V3C99_016604 [Haemonchus contortus]